MKPFGGALHRLYLSALDLSDAAERQKEMIPPRTLHSVGGGDFQGVGQEFRNLFVDYGHLEPDHRELDVGCGIGRMAVPLTSYPSAEGQYEGFDIVKSGIDWCRQNITPKFPNFRFQHSDVQNRNYNPKGTLKAASYRFPYPDESFDFVFLTSVFTHMFRPDLENYTREIARVLASGGTCFVTFFLLNHESEGRIQRGESQLNFSHLIEGGLTTAPKNPGEAIAYPESDVRALFERCQLQVVEPIRYGSWSGRPNFLTMQDVVITKKN